MATENTSGDMLKGDNPDVGLVLPEMWNTGCALNELDGLADKEGLDLKDSLSISARKRSVWLLSEWSAGYYHTRRTALQ